MGEIRMSQIENTMNSTSDILYVTVLYKQRLEETSAFKTLLHDRAHVYIHDNSPEPTIPDSLPAGWKYVSAPSNPGLSAAYNAAARFAKEKGLKWLMITDQDTIYPEGAASVYEKVIEPESAISLYMPKIRISDGSYISPVPKRFYFSHPEKKCMDGIINLRDAAVINSGLLVKLDDFERAGGYNAKVFLDFSDFQFIDRLAKIGCKGALLDLELTQAFSARDDSGERQLERYKLFCRSLKGYEKDTLAIRAALWAVVAKRGLSLAIKRKSMIPFKIMWGNY